MARASGQSASRDLPGSEFLLSRLHLWRHSRFAAYADTESQKPKPVQGYNPRHLTAPSTDAGLGFVTDWCESAQSQPAMANPADCTGSTATAESMCRANRAEQSIPTCNPRGERIAGSKGDAQHYLMLGKSGRIPGLFCLRGEGLSRAGTSQGGAIKACVCSFNEEG